LGTRTNTNGRDGTAKNKGKGHPISNCETQVRGRQKKNDKVKKTLAYNDQRIQGNTQFSRANKPLWRGGGRKKVGELNVVGSKRNRPKKTESVWRMQRRFRAEEKQKKSAG